MGYSLGKTECEGGRMEAAQAAGWGWPRWGGADGQREREREKLIQAHLLVGVTRPERQRTRLLEVENEKNKGRANESRDAEKSDSERLNKDAG